MQMICENDIDVRCVSCGTEISLGQPEVDAAMSHQCDDKHGPRSEWTGDISGQCPRCGRELVVTLYATEYPLGTTCGTVATAYGCTLLTEPDTEVSEEYDTAADGTVERIVAGVLIGMLPRIVARWYLQRISRSSSRQHRALLSSGSLDCIQG